MSNKVLLAWAFWLFVFLGSAHAGPILQVSGGQLTGATGVNVLGALYDAEFVDGMCVAIFDGCNNEDDFPFFPPMLGHDLYVMPTAASHALLTQVLLDTADGNFDSEPIKVQGCSSSPGFGSNDTCRLLTPVSFEHDYPTAAVAENVAADGGNDRVYETKLLDPYIDLSILNSVWVVWKKNESPPIVPEPSTIILFSSGLVALFGYRWQRSRREKATNERRC